MMSSCCGWDPCKGGEGWGRKDSRESRTGSEWGRARPEQQGKAGCRILPAARYNLGAAKGQYAETYLPESLPKTSCYPDELVGDYH